VARFPLGAVTSEPYSVIVPEIMANFIESQDDTDMVRKMRSL
jgi:hypothetical protein